MPLFKKHKVNTLLFPVTEKFSSKIDEASLDKPTEQWCVQASAACHVIAEYLIFGDDSENNWFYHRRSDLTVNKITDLYLTLIPFFYFYSTLKETKGDVSTEQIVKVFGLDVERFADDIEKYVDLYKDYVLNKDTGDSSFGEMTDNIMETVGLPPTVIVHLGAELFERVFDVDIPPPDIKMFTVWTMFVASSFDPSSDQD